MPPPRAPPPIGGGDQGVGAKKVCKGSDNQVAKRNPHMKDNKYLIFNLLCT